MRAKTLAIVQAGGQGSRMDVLTRERAKPALPFAGTFRLIDFSLSSLGNSDIADVWVSVQYLAGSLDPYLAGGRPWDLDRSRGGFRRVVPEEGAAASQAGFAQGNADNLLLIRDDIEDHAPDAVVVMSADSIFACDLDAVVTEHLAVGAECTIVTAETGITEAREKAAVITEGDRVTGLEYKSSHPSATTVATEIFVYDPQVLVEALEALRRKAAHEDTLDEEGIGDFGEDLLPWVIARGRTRAHPLEGYWRDVGRPAAYLQAHRDLLAGRIDVFDRPYGQVRTNSATRPPAHLREGCEVVDSSVASGADVAGTVRRSVLGRGVRVQAGAVVEDCVLMDDVVVEAGAQVRTAVLDVDVVIGRDARVGVDRMPSRLSDDTVTLVGRDGRVSRGAVVPAGSRLEPGTRA